MSEIHQEQSNAIISLIRKRILTVNVIVGIVIFSFLVIFSRYAFPQSIPLISYIPEVSVSIVASAIFILSVTGLYLSMQLSRETIRIIHDYSSRLERMLAITKDLREEIYGDILLEKIMDYALSITDSAAGSLLLLDENKKMVFKIVRGEKASQLLGTAVELGEGITGTVALEGKPLSVSNIKGNKQFNPRYDAMTGFETKSILCVPLKTKAGVVGVLEVLNKEGGHPYRQRDEDILSYLSEQAAISILKTKFAEDQKNYEIHLTDLLLETIDFQQPEKKGHALRVARYSNVLAKALDMSMEEKKRLYFASLLHDVGFLKIDLDEAYKKDIFMQHPVIGNEMIRPITFYAEIAPFILHHHQHYDGNGYPAPKLMGENIPLGARIIAIAEVFDAMTSSQSYKVPVSYEDALEELKQKAGTQFDPGLVDLFIRNITPEHIK
ncbi:MAG: GAF domain-containing protein [Nitrospirae bacterium]|nr:GAF domain-containing protein [Nitrospirota bacterium]